MSCQIICHVFMLLVLMQSPQGSQGSRGIYQHQGIIDFTNPFILTRHSRARASPDSSAAGQRFGIGYRPLHASRSQTALAAGDVESRRQLLEGSPLRGHEPIAASGGGSAWAVHGMP